MVPLLLSDVRSASSLETRVHVEYDEPPRKERRKKKQVFGVELQLRTMSCRTKVRQYKFCRTTKSAAEQ
eukprot:scaffold8103_cov85-Cylindrotheca_fusiformis.AAC.4